VKTFEATRKPRYEGYDSLHGTRRDAPDEFLVLVDGQEIGGTYWCQYNPAAGGVFGWDDGGLPGESWASWGPRGLSCGHPTREAAEDAQVREYVTDPDLFDRLSAMEQAEREAEAARRRAQEDAECERRAADRLRARLGDDEPGPVTWVLPAFFHLYAGPDETAAVGAWLAASGIEDISGKHEVRVEQRAARRVAVYEKHAWVYNGRGTDRTETHVVTIVTDPPALTTPARPDLHPVLAEHWPAQFPLIDFGFGIACGKCTREARAVTADQMVPWPCPVVEKAIASAPAAVKGA
jgi:hypothetical protein